jgi:hypothetical protein
MLIYIEVNYFIFFEISRRKEFQIPRCHLKFFKFSMDKILYYNLIFIILNIHQINHSNNKIYIEEFWIPLKNYFTKKHYHIQIYYKSVLSAGAHWLIKKLVWLNVIITNFRRFKILNNLNDYIYLNYFIF